jgi:hypothetical protein
MDTLSDTTIENVTTTASSAPRGRTSSPRRAIAQATSKGTTPAAPHPADLRQSDIPVGLVSGADETSTSPRPKRGSSRRQQSRATGERQASTSLSSALITSVSQPSRLGGEEQATCLSEPRMAAPAPQPSSSNGGGGETRLRTTPVNGASLPDSFAGLPTSDPRYMAASDEEQAQRSARPGGPLPAPPSFPSAPVAVDEAIECAQPRWRSPRRKQSRGRKVTAGRTTQLTSPVEITSDPTSIGEGNLAGRSDHVVRDTHRGTVAAATHLDGHYKSDPHGSSAVEGDDRVHVRGDIPSTIDPIIAEIRQLWRLRQRWWKAEMKLILQAQALCRMWTEGDKDAAAALFKQVSEDGVGEPIVLQALAPFIAGMQPFKTEGHRFELAIAKKAKLLPVWDAWAKDVWGFSALGLGKVVGECGDVGSYRSPAGLWKRMGLAPHQGHAMDYYRKKGGLSAEEWEALGYSPSRRSVMWNIGGSLIGGMGNGVRPGVDEDWEAREDWSPLQKVYVGRLIYLAHRDEDVRPPSAKGKMSFSKHIHWSAKRYVEKRLLKQLWQAWRRTDRGEA